MPSESLWDKVLISLISATDFDFNNTVVWASGYDRAALSPKTAGQCHGTIPGLSWKDGRGCMGASLINDLASEQMGKSRKMLVEYAECFWHGLTDPNFTL